MKKLFKFDLILLLLLIVFSIISILSIYSSQEIVNDDSLVLRQILWYLSGFGIIFIILKLKNYFIFKYIWIIYIIGNISLLGLLLFATPVNNAKCWYTIPGFGTIQPSEFMKIILILVIAHVISEYHKNIINPTYKNELTLIFKVLGIVFIPTILTFLQPDTGVVLIYLIIAFVMLFVSSIRYRYFLVFLAVALLSIVFILGLYFIDKDLFVNVLGTDFFLRVDRLLDWSSGSGYQLENGMTAIGSSYLFGTGLSNTPIYFPEAQTDFIFAVYANNFGFIGSFILLTLLCLFDLRLVYHANKTNDYKNKFIISGLIAMLLYQQIQNIGMTFGLMPITGITLPFISYGGSSLLSYLIMMGIIFNITKEKTKYSKNI